MISASAVQAQEGGGSAEFRTLSEMARPPKFEELIDAEPFDWVVLHKNELVVKCEAVQPRPGTYLKLQEERDTLRRIKRRSSEQNDRLREVSKVPIRLPGDVSEYSIELELIKDIIGMEQLMLERARLLLDEGDTARAYDLLQRVERLVPEWPATAGVFDEMLLVEAQGLVDRSKPFAALQLLDELYQRTPDYPRLSELMGRLLDELIQQAVEQQDFYQARWLTRRLRSHYEEHPVVQKWTTKLAQQSQQTLQQAVGESRQGELRKAAVLARRADRISPVAGRPRQTLQELTARYQTVRVAVRSLNTEFAFPVPLAAELRHQELVNVPLFEPEAAGEVTRYGSGFVESWDPRDLGREVSLYLKTSQPYWHSQQQLSSSQVADALAGRLDPEHPQFDSRLASFVSGYTVLSPSELEIRFTRVPLNLAALFRFSIEESDVAAAADSSAGDSASEVSSGASLTRRFRLAEHTDSVRRYVRNVPEPDGLIPTQYHVAEIQEQKYDTHHQALQAFRRGEVDILTDVHPWEVEPIRTSGVGFVPQLAAPTCHVIVFHPDSQPVRSAQVRRALSFAVPRESILKNIILRDETMQYGRLSSAPWPHTSYATDPRLEPVDYNLRLALALKYSADEQLRIPLRRKAIAEARTQVVDAGEDWDEEKWRADNAEALQEIGAEIKVPKLRMLCEPDETMQLAAEQMIELWGRIGFEVELVVPANDTEQVPQWDMMYRRVQMQEPLLDLWSVLLTDTTLDVNLLDAYPDWLRQDLTQLDYAGSFRIARDRLFRVQRSLLHQAFLIPLWEVDQFVAFRRTVTGYRDQPISVYDKITRWVIQP